MFHHHHELLRLLLLHLTELFLVGTGEIGTPSSLSLPQKALVLFRGLNMEEGFEN
jgi:hypothetical protein